MSFQRHNSVGYCYAIQTVYCIKDRTYRVCMLCYYIYRFISFFYIVVELVKLCVCQCSIKNYLLTYDFELK